MSNPWTYSQSDRRTSRSSMNKGGARTQCSPSTGFKTSSPRQVSKEAFPKAFPKKKYTHKKKEIPSFNRVKSLESPWLNKFIKFWLPLERTSNNERPEAPPGAMLPGRSQDTQSWCEHPKIVRSEKVQTHKVAKTVWKKRKIQIPKKVQDPGHPVR